MILSFLIIWTILYRCNWKTGPWTTFDILFKHVHQRCLASFLHPYLTLFCVDTLLLWIKGFFVYVLYFIFKLVNNIGKFGPSVSLNIQIFIVLNTIFSIFCWTPCRTIRLHRDLRRNLKLLIVVPNHIVFTNFMFSLSKFIHIQFDLWRKLTKFSTTVKSSSSIILTWKLVIRNTSLFKRIKSIEGICLVKPFFDFTTFFYLIWFFNLSRAIIIIITRFDLCLIMINLRLIKTLMNKILFSFPENLPLLINRCIIIFSFKLRWTMNSAFENVYHLV